MQSFLIYILQAAGCISITWLFYKTMMDKKTRAKTIRYYFLIAIMVSMLTPLSPWAIRTSLFASTTSEVTANTIGQVNAGNVEGVINSHQAVAPVETAEVEKMNVIKWLFYGYLAITAFFILRMGRELFAIVRCYRKGTKEKCNNLQIIWNDDYKASFSFFGLIFLNKKYLTTEEFDKVLAHERIHATQYHSADLLLMQLVSAR